MAFYCLSCFFKRNQEKSLISSLLVFWAGLFLFSFAQAKSPDSNLDGARSGGGAVKPSGLLQLEKPQPPEQAVATGTSKQKSTDAKRLPQPSSVKRGLSQEDEPLLCKNHFRSKYKTGGVLLSIPCKPDVDYCLSFSETLRNRCNEVGHLIRYQCDQEAPNGVSAEIIECENGCEFGLCKPDESSDSLFF